MKKFMNKLKGDKGDAGSSDAPAKSTSTQPTPSSAAQPAATSQSTGAAATGGATGGATGEASAEGAKGVLFNTTLGDLTIALYTDETPKVRYTTDFCSHNTDTITDRHVATSPPLQQPANTTMSFSTASFPVS